MKLRYDNAGKVLQVLEYLMLLLENLKRWNKVEEADETEGMRAKVAHCKI